MPEVLTQVNPDDECVLKCPFDLPEGHKVKDHPQSYIETERRKFPDMREMFARLHRREELHSLEREVVEAAKAELAAYGAPGDFGWTTNYHAARQRLWKATRALINFESQHK